MVSATRVSGLMEIVMESPFLSFPLRRPTRLLEQLTKKSIFINHDTRIVDTIVRRPEKDSLDPEDFGRCLIFPAHFKNIEKSKKLVSGMFAFFSPNVWHTPF